MLKSKELLNFLQDELGIIGTKKMLRDKFENYLEKKYKLPPVEYSAYIIGAKNLEEIDPQIAFWLIDAVNTINSKSINVKNYFSDLEIRQFSKSEYTFQKDEIYPIIINNVIEVAYDQWVTVMSIKQIKELQDKQLLVYNPNTQRELKKKVKNGDVYYTINVNMSSVNDIEKELLSGEFIPNDLSFNLNIDNPEVDFDVADGSMIVNGGQFDIIDGFHRFSAAVRAFRQNPDIDFKFTVNLMNFDEKKACAFIAQQNKRNKISRTYSKSLDANDSTNIVINRLNTSPNSLIKGMIGKEGTNIVNVTDLFIFIDTFYDTKKMSRSDLLRTSNHIINVFNICVDNNHDLLQKINTIDLGIIVYGSTLGTDEFECYENIQKAIANKSNIQRPITTLNKKSIGMIKNLFV